MSEFVHLFVGGGYHLYEIVEFSTLSKFKMAAVYTFHVRFYAIIYTLISGLKTHMLECSYIWHDYLGSRDTPPIAPRDPIWRIRTM